MEVGVRYRYLSEWLKGYRGTLFNVLISSILVTFLGMNWPLVYRYIINHVFYGGAFDEFGFILIVYVTLFIAEKLLQFIWKLADARMASDFIYHIKESLYKKIFSLKMSSKSKYSSGEVLDMINNDVGQLYTFLIDEGVFAVTCFVRLIMSLIYIYLINRMAAIFIFLLVILNYFLSKYLKQRFMVYYREYKDQLEKYNAFLTDLLSGLKEIKLFLAAAYAREKVALKFEHMGQLKKKQLYEETYRDICSDALNVFSEMILYVAAAFAVVKGSMQLGDFISLMIYYEWAKIFFRIFVQLFTGASKSFVSLDRINQLMDEESEGDGGCDASTGDISFQNVRFGYCDNIEVLKGISFCIKENSVVALAGTSGSGKSTVASLLLKLYEPWQGEIRIGDRILGEMNIKSLRTRIGVVHQNAGLLEGTIRRNLLMGKCDATEEELWEALKISRADEFVSQLPEQLDAEINQLENLSTGQCQRIVMARVFLKNPDIIIFDEATSNIDIETEKKFLKDAAMVFKEKTVIIIAYRVNSLEVTDKVLYLGAGKVQYMGRHCELLERNEEYRKLVYAKGGMAE